jgi:hypothetical protein
VVQGSIPRPREEYDERLRNDYFSRNPPYSAKKIRRRFRMNKHLILRIVQKLGTWSSYFTARVDGLSCSSHSPLQKCRAAIRQLARGSAADDLDEYLKIGDSTAMECMKKFAEGIIAMFGEEYLRQPSTEDLESLLKLGESFGFLGSMESQIVCIGIERDASMHGGANLPEVIRVFLPLFWGQLLLSI